MAFIDFIPSNEDSCFKALGHFRSLWGNEKTFTDENIELMRHYLSMMMVHEDTSDSIKTVATITLNELTIRIANKRIVELGLQNKNTIKNIMAVTGNISPDYFLQSVE